MHARTHACMLACLRACLLSCLLPRWKNNMFLVSVPLSNSGNSCSIGSWQREISEIHVARTVLLGSTAPPSIRWHPLGAWPLPVATDMDIWMSHGRSNFVSWSASCSLDQLSALHFKWRLVSDPSCLVPWQPMANSTKLYHIQISVTYI